MLRILRFNRRDGELPHFVTGISMIQRETWLTILRRFKRHARETEPIKFAEYFANNRGFRFPEIYPGSPSPLNRSLIPGRAIKSAYPRITGYVRAEVL